LFRHVSDHDGTVFDELLLQMIHEFFSGEPCVRFHCYRISKVDMLGVFWFGGQDQLVFIA